jgi:hypothetical protein
MKIIQEFYLPKENKDSLTDVKSYEPNHLAEKLAIMYLY